MILQHGCCIGRWFPLVVPGLPWPPLAACSAAACKGASSASHGHEFGLPELPVLAPGVREMPQ